MIFVNRHRIIQNSGVVKDPTKYWYIEKYVYGKLKEIVEIPLGTGTTFKAIDSGYSDDTFYGWSINSTSTTRKFTATTTYKNTTSAVKNNLDDTNTLKIYAIYKYTETHEEEQSTSVRLECSQSDHTIIVKDAVIGTKYSVYEQEATISQNTIHNSDGSVVYGPSFGYDSSVLLTSGTATSSTISYTFNYRQVSGSVLVGTNTIGTTNTHTETFYRNSPMGQITYTHLAKKSTTKYRVERYESITGGGGITPIN